MSDQLGLGSRLKKNDDLAWRRIEDEIVLVPLKRRSRELDSILTLNEVAAFAWELIDGEIGVGDILHEIVREFEVEPARAEADLLELLRELQDAGVVHVVE